MKTRNISNRELNKNGLKNKPVILREGRYGVEDVNNLKKKFKAKIVDIYPFQLKEMFSVLKETKTKKNPQVSGDWIYYGWSNILLHTLSEKENDILKTNRNKNIITEKEQKKLADFTIAVAGLSVGGNIATTCLYNGFPKKIKLADFDFLETTNLNRFKGKLSDVSLSKIEVVRRQLYEINPYIKIISFGNGIDEGNLNSFVAGAPKPKLIFEIIDDFKMKILIRKTAQKYKIPVVMLTSLGDNVLIDTERYDIDSKTKLFNGKVSEKTIEKILAGKITEDDKKEYALQIAGRENIPLRAIESVKQIGKTLVGRPQIMSTVTAASGIAAFLARKIALGEPILSGRTIIKFNDFINVKNQ